MLSILGLLVSALVVYAIYRYGVIPAIRNRPTKGLWGKADWEFRFTVIASFVAFALATAAGVMFMAGLHWEAGIAFLVAVAIGTVTIQRRSKKIRRYRGW